MPDEDSFDIRGKRFARVVTFYLPQFHQIPENDEWWEPGFTEWTNVKRAKSLFPGHHQPRIPGQLGYYDLRNPTVRQQQAELAENSGIEAFCYWHYWFGGGRKILELPFNEVVSSGKPSVSFCVAWANQTWTGIWHGAPNRVLIEQTYPGRDDERQHFLSLLPAFEDSRYMTVEGKPIFVVYDAQGLPDSESFVAHWRKLAEEAGLPGLYIIGMSNRLSHPSLKPFDATMQFGPSDFLARQPYLSATARALRIISNKLFVNFLPERTLRRLQLPARYDFADVVSSAFSDYRNSEVNIPCVLSGWDNTPRSGRRGVVFENFSAELFRAYLKKAISYVRSNSPQERIVFIKAWNEWAEGNYLEPDANSGSELLDVVRNEVLGTNSLKQ